MINEQCLRWGHWWPSFGLHLINKKPPDDDCCTRCGTKYGEHKEEKGDKKIGLKE